mgnify:CR=1 FL=1
MCCARITRSPALAAVTVRCRPTAGPSPRLPVRSQHQPFGARSPLASGSARRQRVRPFEIPLPVNPRYPVRVAVIRFFLAARSQPHLPLFKFHEGRLHTTIQCFIQCFRNIGNGLSKRKSRLEGIATVNSNTGNFV